MKVYSLAKSVADLFKYRNKVGLDVALEVLREAWRSRRATVLAKGVDTPFGVLSPLLHGAASVDNQGDVGDVGFYGALLSGPGWAVG